MTATLSLDRNLVLAAGAGSGKTHTLVTLAMALYAGGPHGPPISPERLWIVTFTDKAARELVERIEARASAIAERSAEELAASEPDFLALIGGAPDPTVWSAARASLAHAPIGTFHSLCARLLREWDHGGQQRILDEAEAGEILSRTMEQVLHARLEGRGAHSDALIDLVASLGRLDDLRRAVATVIRIAREEGSPAASLLEPLAADARDERELDQACRSLALALDGLLESSHPRLALVVEALRAQRDRLGGCAVDELSSWYPIVAGAMARPRGRGALPAAPKARFDRAREAWQRVQLATARREEARLSQALGDVVDAVERAYDERKRQLEARDFSDLVREVRDRLVDQPDRLEELRARVSFLLVDECQDTNAVQFDLVTLLCAAEPSVAVSQPIFDRMLAPRSFGAVGDRKQSIYEFRGADVSLFRTLMDVAESNEGFRLAALDRSFRSTPPVVEACNRLFAALMGGANPASFEVRWRPHDALKPVREAQRHVERPVVVLESLSDPGSGGRPGPESEPRTDPEQVADHIAALLADPSQEVQPEDVAILLRAHRHAGVYATALAERGVSSVVSGGRGFFEAVEVQHVLALLVALFDPDDPLAVAIVLRSPLIAAQPETDWDSQLALLGRAMSLAPQPQAQAGRARASLGPRPRARIEAIAATLARIRESSLEDPVAALEQAIVALRVRQTLATTDGARQRLANVGKLLARLERADPLDVLGLARRWLTAGGRELSDGPAEPGLDWPTPRGAHDASSQGAVRIMTIHASKGLEFPIVVVPELGRSEPPERGRVVFARGYGMALRVRDPAGRLCMSEAGRSVAALAAKRREAESLRLLYVACTRARDRLILAGRRRSEDATARDWRTLIDGELGSLADVVHEIGVPPFEARPPQPERSTSQPAPPEVSPATSVMPQAHVELTVSQCADLLHCERRFVWTHVNPVADLGDPADRAASYGGFAHRILEVIEPAAVVDDPGAAAEQAAQRLGHQPGRDAGRDAVVRRVARFLAFPEPQRVFGVGARSPRRLMRELPFVLQLDPDQRSEPSSDQLALFRPAPRSGVKLRVRGQVDLLAIADDGGVEIIDYKLGAPHDAYRGQLALYARAAAALWTDAARAGRVRSAVWSIGQSVGRRVDPESPVAVVPDELDAVSDQLLALAGRHAARQARGDRRAVPRLAQPRLCGRCRFFERCWPDGSGAAC